MGMSYDSPSVAAVEPTPTKEPTKSISAGASAAADAQQQKARKNRGLVSSILTSRAGTLEGDSKKSSTLG